MLAKAEALWAELVCDAPFEQWTIGNETYAVELDDESDALGRAYGRAIPIACDLEWYATADPGAISDGYGQRGRLLGTVETVDGPLELENLQAYRTHRWVTDGSLTELDDRIVMAHLGPRLPFRMPNGTVRDLRLTPDGLVSASA